MSPIGTESHGVVWTPSSEQFERSNVGRFMRRHGIGSYAELVERSTADIAWFWNAVVDDLGIEFYEPYRQVLDDSRGMAWTQWFVGGKLNLVHNCLDKHAASSRRDKVAIIGDGETGEPRRLTYGELYREVNRLASALRRLGIGRGDRVAVFLPMVPETVVAFLAVAKLGAIVVPIFSGYGSQAVAARLNDCGTKLLVTADGFRRRGALIPMIRVAGDAARECPSLEHVLVLKHVGQGELSRPGFEVWWHEAVAGESAECATEVMDSEDPFLIIYTSGTTGRPKGSVHVHGGFLVKIAQEVSHQADLQENDVLHWITDLGWIMGPWKLVGGLALGGTIVVSEGAPDYPGPDRMWRQAERLGVTILGVSPTLIRALMKYGDEPVRAHDLSRLRILGSTGEPWNTDPWLWLFHHVGGGRCPIINFSGGTEVGACLLSALPITPLKPCSLVGPSLGMDVDVFGPDGRPLAHGVGELVCKQPWPGMTRGLWKDPDRYLATYWSRWPNVWVHGDWASVDADGFWFLHGRSDDTIKIAGKRIGPAEIESALVSHAAVAEAAAVGVPHELKGEVVWCYAVLAPGHQPTEELRSSLRAWLADRLGHSFAPERIKFVPELPRTRSAKILRRALRAHVLGEDPGDLSSLENPHALEALDHAL